MSEFVLPEAPPQESQAVKAWAAEPVIIRSYTPMPADSQLIEQVLSLDCNHELASEFAQDLSTEAALPPRMQSTFTIALKDPYA